MPLASPGSAPFAGPEMPLPQVLLSNNGREVRPLRGQPASWPRFLGESFGSGLASGGGPLGLAGFAFAMPLIFLARDGATETSAAVPVLVKWARPTSKDDGAACRGARMHLVLSCGLEGNEPGCHRRPAKPQRDVRSPRTAAGAGASRQGARSNEHPESVHAGRGHARRP